MASILKPEFKAAYELQYVNADGVAEYWDCGDSITKFKLTTGLKGSILNLHIERRGGYWQIVRASDGIVIAQSKQQPAPTPAAAPVATEADSDLPFATFDDSVDTVQDSAAETCTCGEPLTVREEAERGFCVYCAYDYEKPSPKPTKTTRFTGTGSRGIPNGHGRNRRNAPISRPNRVSKRRKVSTAMMEAKTPKNANKAKQGLTQGLIRQQYAVAQMGYRRQREREMAAAMEHARCMVTINRQMSALGVAA